MRGTVIKRGATYSVVLDLGKDDAGNRVRKWHSGFTSKKEAEKARTALLGQLDTGAYVEPSKATLGNFLDEWLGTIEHRVRPTTLASYTQIVTSKVKPRIGGVELRKLSPAHLNRIYGELMASGKRDGKAMSPKSVRNVHITIHRALEDAVRWGRVARNAADHADPPAVVRPQLHTWSATEMRTFLASVADDPFHAAWRLLASTGVRRGELLGLRWSDVDLQAATVSIVQQVTTVGNKPIMSSPKTAKGRRSVSLDRASVAALRAHRRVQAAQRLAIGEGWANLDLVFTKEDGDLIHPDLFSRWFTQRAKAAELPVIRLHDLRHSHASIALAAGVHIKVVSERLGHATTAITADVYSHVAPSMHAEAAEIVARLVSGE